jgi:uncharacterized SAM-binding protein YcdF (DUF218 family)
MLRCNGDKNLVNLLPRSLLLPPVNLLLLAMIFWMMAYRYPRLGWRLLGLCLLGMFVLAMPITPALLLEGLELGIVLKQPTAGLANNPGAIIILGGDFGFGEPAGAIFTGAQPGSLTLERVRAGAALQRRTGLPILVTGGASHVGGIAIATLMRQSLQDDFGVTARWVEPNSSDTWQNADFTAAILKKEGISAAYVVSQSWHLRRAAIAFRHFDFVVWPAPVSLADFDGLKLEMFQPTVSAWLDSYWALHEWVGCAVYALRR